MPGIGHFYGGLLHPVIVPSHLLALVSLGLLLGQRGLLVMRTAYPCFLVALLLGLAIAALSPATAFGAETSLLAIACACGIAVALRFSVHTMLLAPLVILTAMTLGADSGVSDLDRRETFGAMLGAGLGACVLLIVVAGLAEMPRREWQRVLVRVIGSWCAASALLVLALELR